MNVEDEAVFELGWERVLVVEDDREVRDIPVSLLRARGCEVVEVEDGQAAIEQLEDGRHFDLLFTVIVLPGGMNGTEIATEAKRLHPKMRVIYTAGYAKNTILNLSNLQPGEGVINKPYRRSELLEKVRFLLNEQGI